MDTFTSKGVTDHILLFFFFAVFVFLGCLIWEIIRCAKFQKQDGGGEKNPHDNLGNKQSEFSSYGSSWQFSQYGYNF